MSILLAIDGLQDQQHALRKHLCLGNWNLYCGSVAGPFAWAVPWNALPTVGCRSPAAGSEHSAARDLARLRLTAGPARNHPRRGASTNNIPEVCVSWAHWLLLAC